MGSKIVIGDLLYDGHFYGIVTDYDSKSRFSVSTVWFDFMRQMMYDNDLLVYSEETVVQYKDNFARWSTG